MSTFANHVFDFDLIWPRLTFLGRRNERLDLVQGEGENLYNMSPACNITHMMKIYAEMN